MEEAVDAGVLFGGVPVASVPEATVDLLSDELRQVVTGQDQPDLPTVAGFTVYATGADLFAKYELPRHVYTGLSLPCLWTN